MTPCSNMVSTEWAKKHCIIDITKGVVEARTMAMKNSTWWWISAAVSIVLVIVLVNLWIQMNQFVVEPTQLVNEQAVSAYLQENWEDRVVAQAGHIEPSMRVKTGIFIQSLKFFNSTEVNITGYIWQRYQNDLHKSIIPGPDEIGFVLPEQVDSSFDPREVYRVRTANEETIGWYFEATVRQPFDYATYPFDHKTVWMRIWHKQFSGNIILVPDFGAYKGTGLADMFGIAEDIVLDTWERENTYFDYSLSNYDTNFGISSYVGQQGFPELHYNLVVKRKFENAFIIYLLPLFLVATLLFAGLLTVSADEELTSRLGFDASGFIASCSVLFFVVMLAHIQLREQFAGSSIVYIEYFYILMYSLLVLATVNTYLFSIRPKHGCGFILYRDNIVAKVGYWPAVLGSLILITLGFL